MPSIFEELSAERKALQADGKLPEWFTTIGWQIFKDKYLYQAETFEEQVDRIVSTVGKYCYSRREYFEGRWKEMLMENHMYLATPVLANTGTSRGMSVSCSGGFIEDSVYGFGYGRLESSILSQEGFGTSSYLGAVRERGASISRGGTADGVLPVFEDMVTMAEKISQGATRRGAWAGYLELDHGDFWEIAMFVKNNPEGANVGWVITDKIVEALNRGDEDMTKRFQRAMYLKAITGKGYFYFVDKVARQQPEMYGRLGLSSKASNLCTEITLHSDELHTYTCVIGGMVATTFPQWKHTDAAYCALVFQDCLVSEFLTAARGVRGLENVVRGTEKGRPVGLGLTGLHSLFQQEGLPFGSFEAHMLNNEVYKHLDDSSRKASLWMGREWGEPEWCRGTGYRNTHRGAQAPNTSSSAIFGSFSQGATPWYGNVYNEGSASGALYRVNPLFIELLKKHGQYNDEVLDYVLDDNGSCRGLTFLSDEEKELFLTAFEINQRDIIRLAAQRQRFICQAQSINLFFDADEKEEYIAQIHQEAFENPGIMSLYYLRSKAGITASRGACAACES